MYNNTKGDADARTLKAFRERAWNNPVVRIVSTDRADVIPRHAGDYSVAGLADAMARGLRSAGKPVPAWLELFARETTARKRGVETAIFGMG